MRDETRKEKGTLRKLQEGIMSEMSDRGAIVYVVNSKTEVDELFNILIA